MHRVSIWLHQGSACPSPHLLSNVFKLLSSISALHAFIIHLCPLPCRPSLPPSITLSSSNLHIQNNKRQACHRLSFSSIAPAVQQPAKKTSKHTNWKRKQKFQTRAPFKLAVAVRLTCITEKRKTLKRTHKISRAFVWLNDFVFFLLILYIV